MKQKNGSSRAPTGRGDPRIQAIEVAFSVNRGESPWIDTVHGASPGEQGAPSVIARAGT